MARASSAAAAVLEKSEPAKSLAPEQEVASTKVKGAAVKPATPAVTIPPLTIERIMVKIHGISPLIMHKMSEKARKQMRDKKMGRAQGKREPCNPDKEFEDAKYLDEKGRDCFPSLALKGAITNAASFAEGVTKVELRGALFIPGEFIPVKYKRCEMREDAVRVGNGAADLRYRPYYHEWEAEVPIEFNKHVITAEQVCHLVELAGFSVGIGDWRPQRNGQYGRFGVD